MPAPAPRGHTGPLACQVRSINKLDVATLRANFGSLRNIVHASKDELAHCPGLGERKVRALLEVFDQPFVPSRHPRSQPPAPAPAAAPAAPD